jgi:predicted permease
VVYAIATAVAFLRRRSIEEAAVEAQCAVIGNTGFLGVPMLIVLMGEAAAGPVNEFLAILGAAATPGALFAIGASLAGKSAERIEVAGWLSFCKLVLHPLAVAFAALMLFPVETFDAAVMIAAASLPVAGNVYILAQHYGVAPQRVSASILISTAVSIVTVSVVIAWVSQMAGIVPGG